MQVQILKGAEEDQVEWNVVRTTTIGIRGCPEWANGTMEEKLWADYPHAVWIRQGIFNDVAILTIPNVKWIRRDGCQTILRHKKSVIYYVYTRYIHGIYLVFKNKGTGTRTGTRNVP
jgi:hypothetical protein